MRLQARMVVTTVAIGLPLVLTLGLFANYLSRQAVKDKFVQSMIVYMTNLGREKCEASPEAWSGEGMAPFLLFGDPRHPLKEPPLPWEDHPRPDGPPPWSSDHPRPDGPMGPPRFMDGNPPPRPPHSMKVFAYDANLRSVNSEAPVLDAALAEDLQPGGTPLSVTVNRDGEPPSRLLVPMPWRSGPCAVLLARDPGSGDFPPGGGTFPPLYVWLPPMLAVLAALFLTMGPLVRRIRLLTREVRQSEQARYQSRITLRGNDEVAELARAFDEAGFRIREHIREQERREKTLRDFLENTTHDVMIPLTVLQGHLASMNEDLKMHEAIKDAAVDAAINETNYMASLIHNLHVAAKIEAGEPAMQRHPVDLNAMMERIMIRQRPIARQAGVSLDGAVPEFPIRVEGDVTFIEQAVTNVVYNAIRYNDRDGHVAVLLEPADAGRFTLRVLDDGPGIPEDEIQRLVERFYRGNVARKREAQGQGLGLNIAYQLARLHGWEFELSPSEFGGLQVEFRGPRLNGESSDGKDG